MTEYHTLENIESSFRSQTSFLNLRSIHEVLNTLKPVQKISCVLFILANTSDHDIINCILEYLKSSSVNIEQKYCAIYRSIFYDCISTSLTKCELESLDFWMKYQHTLLQGLIHDINKLSGHLKKYFSEISMFACHNVTYSEAHNLLLRSIGETMMKNDPQLQILQSTGDFESYLDYILECKLFNSRSLSFHQVEETVNTILFVASNCAESTSIGDFILSVFIRSAQAIHNRVRNIKISYLHITSEQILSQARSSASNLSHLTVDQVANGVLFLLRLAVSDVGFQYICSSSKIFDVLSWILNIFTCLIAVGGNGNVEANCDAINKKDFASEMQLICAIIHKEGMEKLIDRVASASMSKRLSLLDAALTWLARDSQSLIMHSLSLSTEDMSANDTLMSHDISIQFIKCVERSSNIYNISSGSSISSYGMFISHCLTVQQVFQSVICFHVMLQIILSGQRNSSELIYSFRLCLTKLSFANAKLSLSLLHSVMHTFIQKSFRRNVRVCHESSNWQAGQRDREMTTDSFSQYLPCFSAVQEMFAVISVALEESEIDITLFLDQSFHPCGVIRGDSSDCKGHPLPLYEFLTSVDSDFITGNLLLLLTSRSCILRNRILIWIEKLVKSSLDEAVHVASILHSCTRILTECIQISPPDILREFIHQFIRTCKGVCVDSTSSSGNKWKTSNSLAVLTTLLTRAQEDNAILAELKSPVMTWNIDSLVNKDISVIGEMTNVSPSNESTSPLSYIVHVVLAALEKEWQTMCTNSEGVTLSDFRKLLQKCTIEHASRINFDKDLFVDQVVNSCLMLSKSLNAIAKNLIAKESLLEYIIPDYSSRAISDDKNNLAFQELLNAIQNSNEIGSQIMSSQHLKQLVCNAFRLELLLSVSKSATKFWTHRYPNLITRCVYCIHLIRSKLSIIKNVHDQVWTISTLDVSIFKSIKCYVNKTILVTAVGKSLFIYMSKLLQLIQRGKDESAQLHSENGSMQSLVLYIIACVDLLAGFSASDIIQQLSGLFNTSEIFHTCLKIGLYNSTHHKATKVQGESISHFDSLYLVINRMMSALSDCYARKRSIDENLVPLCSFLCIANMLGIRRPVLHIHGQPAWIDIFGRAIFEETSMSSHTCYYYSTDDDQHLYDSHKLQFLVCSRQNTKLGAYCHVSISCSKSTSSYLKTYYTTVSDIYESQMPCIKDYCGLVDGLMITPSSSTLWDSLAFDKGHTIKYQDMHSAHQKLVNSSFHSSSRTQLIHWQSVESNSFNIDDLARLHLFYFLPFDFHNSRVDMITFIMRRIFLRDKSSSSKATTSQKRKNAKQEFTDIRHSIAYSILKIVLDNLPTTTGYVCRCERSLPMKTCTWHPLYLLEMMVEMTDEQSYNPEESLKKGRLDFFHSLRYIYNILSLISNQSNLPSSRFYTSFYRLVFDARSIYTFNCLQTILLSLGSYVVSGIAMAYAHACSSYLRFFSSNLSVAVEIFHVLLALLVVNSNYTKEIILSHFESSNTTDKLRSDCNCVTAAPLYVGKESPLQLMKSFLTSLYVFNSSEQFVKEYWSHLTYVANTLSPVICTFEKFSFHHDLLDTLLNTSKLSVNSSALIQKDSYMANAVQPQHQSHISSPEKRKIRSLLVDDNSEAFHEHKRGVGKSIDQTPERKLNDISESNCVISPSIKLQIQTQVSCKTALFEEYSSCLADPIPSPPELCDAGKHHSNSSSKIADSTFINPIEEHISKSITHDDRIEIWEDTSSVRSKFTLNF